MNVITHADCFDFIPTLENRCIDLLILDPPYNNYVNQEWDKQWKSKDDYTLWFDNLIGIIEPKVKLSCSVYLFGYAQQLYKLIPIMEKHEFTFKQFIVIDKGLKSISGRTSNKVKMFPTATEYICLFYREARHIIRDMLNDILQKKNIQPKQMNERLGKASTGGGTWSSIAGKKQLALQYPIREDWDKLEVLFEEKFPYKYDDIVYKFNMPQGVTDVWNDINFYRDKNIKIHPTQKPLQLLKRIILASSNKGDLVCDPFAGSGVTARVCKDLERNYVACEKDSDYYEKAVKFVNANA
jgi:DNA modification methylase